MAKFERDYQLFIGQVDSDEGLLCTPPLNIEFSVHKSIVNRPNIARFKVYNLNAQSRQKVQSQAPLPLDSVRYPRSPSPGFPIVLAAGYKQETGPRVLFSGVGKWVFQYKTEADIILEIFASESSTDQFRINSFVAKTFVPGVNGGYSGYLDDLETRLKDYNLRLDAPKIADADKCTRGRVFCGYDETILTDMAQKYNSSWYIADGDLKVIPRGYFNTAKVAKVGNIAEAIDISYDTGLLGPPALTSTGIIFETLLDPLITTGTAVRILPDLLQPAGNPDSFKEAGPLASQNVQNTESKYNDVALSYPFAPLNRASIYRVVDIVYSGVYREGKWVNRITAWDASLQPVINSAAAFGTGARNIEEGAIEPAGTSVGTSYVTDGQVNVIEGGTIN